MSDRGDVTFELYCERDKTEEVIRGIVHAISGLTNDGDVAMVAEAFGEYEPFSPDTPAVVMLDSDWLDVQNNEGNTGDWVNAIAEAKPDGLFAFEIRNALSDGTYTWRWAPDLGVFFVRNDPEYGDSVDLFNLMAYFEQARHETTDQLDRLWHLVAEQVGYAWIERIQQLQQKATERPVRLPMPGERFTDAEYSATVVASTWINDDDPIGPTALIMTLNAEPPFYGVKDLRWTQGRWHIEYGESFPNINPATEAYAQRGGDY